MIDETHCFFSFEYIQPLNACFTPQSSRFSSYHPVTNPYESSVELREGGGKIQLMGHSGSPVEDISRQVPHRSPVEIMCDTLKWGNICPTAPGTFYNHIAIDEDAWIESFVNVEQIRCHLIRTRTQIPLLFHRRIFLTYTLPAIK